MTALIITIIMAASLFCTAIGSAIVLREEMQDGNLQELSDKIEELRNRK